MECSAGYPLAKVHNTHLNSCPQIASAAIDSITSLMLHYRYIIAVVYMQDVSVHLKEMGARQLDKARVYNRKSVQLPYGFYTRHLDRMT